MPPNNPHEPAQNAEDAHLRMHKYQQRKEIHIRMTKIRVPAFQDFSLFSPWDSTRAAVRSFSLHLLMNL